MVNIIGPRYANHVPMSANYCKERTPNATFETLMNARTYMYIYIYTYILGHLHKAAFIEYHAVGAK